MKARLAAVLVGVCAMLIGCGSEPSSDRATDSQGNGERRAAKTFERRASTETTGKTYRIQLSAGEAQSLVYETSNRDEIVRLELYSDKIVFTALISRRKFEETRVLKPPTYFIYRGLEYVRNDGLLFWGNVGKSESISVDGKILEGFVLVNRSQISTEGEAARMVLEELRSSKYLKLEKHYWGGDQQKGFPSFDLSSVQGDLPKLNASSASSFIVGDSETRCRQEGLRKIVWVETSAGVFALNGPALALLRSRRNDGHPWLDLDGRPVRVGRDVLGVDVTASLIKAGLLRCESS